MFNEKTKEIKSKIFIHYIVFIFVVLFTSCILIGAFVNQTRATNTKLRKLREELDRTNNSLSIATNRLEQSESVIERCKQSTNRISEITKSSVDTLRGTINSLREIKQEVEYMEGLLSLYISDSGNSNDSNDNEVSNTVDKCKQKR